MYCDPGITACSALAVVLSTKRSAGVEGVGKRKKDQKGDCCRRGEGGTQSGQEEGDVGKRVRRKGKEKRGGRVRRKSRIRHKSVPEMDPRKKSPFCPEKKRL